MKTSKAPRKKSINWRAFKRSHILKVLTLIFCCCFLFLQSRIESTEVKKKQVQNVPTQSDDAQDIDIDELDETPTKKSTLSIPRPPLTRAPTPPITLVKIIDPTRAPTQEIPTEISSIKISEISSTELSSTKEPLIESISTKKLPSIRKSPLIDAENAFSKAIGSLDSKVVIYQRDPREYRVCQMDNVCFDSYNFYIVIEDDETRKYYQEEQKLCEANDPERKLFCRCFSKSMSPVFIKSLSELINHNSIEEHIWVSDQWAQSHHIFLYTHQRVLFHSIFLKENDYGLSDIDRVALVKNRTPMFNFEEVLYNVSISRLSSPIQKPPLLSKDLHRPVCASKVSTSPIQGLFARTKEEMQTFRDDMHRYIGLNHPKNRCPPPTTYLLLRPETEGRRRKMINQDLVEKLLIETFNIQNLKTATITYNTPAKDQIEIFGNFGLMLSPHGSQLTGLIFSQPGAAVVEVVPTYFNSDFSHIAEKSGVYHQFSIGGKINEALDSTIQECNKNFGECINPRCYPQVATCPNSVRTEIKQPDFEADLEMLKKVLTKSIKYLDFLCDGHWPGRGEAVM